ncbi:hypothetical protein ABT040_13660 [Streptomyces sp. NPDC002688]|uniref:hypothetical protein n=1 Tax=Streptomyces sp. NPDC002688 TaxID=3154423 RepID=UPI00331FB67C
MKRAVVAVVGVVAGCLLLGGCGPEIRPLAAVRLDTEGAPRAVLRPCGDDLIRGLSLVGAPAGTDSGRNRSGWKVPGKRHGTRAEFPLFSPPSAWRARASGQQRLVPDYTYRLGFGKAEFNYEYTGTVTFRAADLATLKPGQVWADDRAMSLGEFERLAEDSC